MKKSLLLPIRLLVPAVKSDSALLQKSWLLTCATTYNDLDILGFADPSKTKNPELNLFTDIEPNSDDGFVLELGVILPDLFVNLDGKPDFEVEALRNDKKFALFVSNRMARIRYSNNGEQFQAIIPRASVSDGPSTEASPAPIDKVSLQLVPHPATTPPQDLGADLKAQLKIPNNPHTEFLRTMVAIRFPIKGTSAEDALSDGIGETVSIFIDLLNRFAISNLMVDREQSGVTTPIYDRNTFDCMYLVIQGKNDKQFRTGRLGMNIFKLMLNPGPATPEESAKIRGCLGGSQKIDEARRFLVVAKSFLDGGILQAALLHLAIGVEMATTRFVHAKLLAAGVSKSKLDGSDDQLTFSKMLNIDLLVVTPADRKPDPQILGKINEIRKLRNDLMHKGMFAADNVKLRDLYLASRQFVAYLDGLP
jgi:hypothetical protein